MMTTAHQEQLILFELKQMKRHVPTGVYCIPLQDNLFEWHGIIFLHQGLFKGAIFKYKIILPPDYPGKAIPRVVFFRQMRTDIFHPLIDPQTCELNLQSRFPATLAWSENKCFIWDILVFIKKIFCDPVETCLSAEAAANKEAYRLITSKNADDRGLLLEKLEEWVGISRMAATERTGGFGLRFPDRNDDMDDLKTTLIDNDKTKAMTTVDAVYTFFEKRSHYYKQNTTDSSNK